MFSIGIREIRSAEPKPSVVSQISLVEMDNQSVRLMSVHVLFRKSRSCDQWNSIKNGPPSCLFSILKEGGPFLMVLSDYTKILSNHRHELAAGAKNTKKPYFFIKIHQ